MKIHGPLQSIEARGTIAGFLTFSKRKSGQQVRYQSKQKDVITAPRLEQRAKFLDASLACRYMSYGEAIYGVALYGNNKDYYSNRAKNKNMTGYNLCILEYL